MQEYHNCKCGREWVITKTRVIMRDKDRLTCYCGQIIISWNEAAIYAAEPVEKD